MILKETTRAGLNAGWVLPPAGIYCPTITFFENESNQDVDLVAQEAHTRFLLSANVHGITVHGTTGEAPMLSHSERNTIVKLVARVRRDMDRLGTTAIVVGCSGQSTREVVAMCEDAAECGGDFVLVLPPSYWSKASTPQVIENFYTEVSLDY
jgi:dihydrodipicolinate synthase/N-acetylneuraminate lyase